MSDERHTVYFEGSIADGFSIGQVKKNLVKLFKSDADRISQLFSGERVALKKDIDLATAQKYHAILRNAGALVIVDAANDAAHAGAGAQSAAQNQRQEQPVYGWSLAPPGSPLLQKSEQTEPPVVNIDVSHLSLASVFAAHKPAVVAQAAAPDTSHLSVAAAGAPLVKTRQPETAPALDLSGLSIAPPGVKLGQGAAAEAIPPQLDLSEYVLLDPGTETGQTRAKKPPPPEPPDTSHIELLAEPEEQSASS